MISPNKILDRTAKWASSGKPREVLTVDQPVDGPYFYMRLKRENPERAACEMELLTSNGGGANSSGTGISNIDTQGNVHPDQFWHELTLGNVKEHKFSDIWSNRDNATLNALRDRKQHLTGKCAQCSFLDLCGGGFRVRALQMTGVWAPDPSCYLNDQEIGLDQAARSYSV